MISCARVLAGFGSLAAMWALVIPSAGADPYLPPAGKVFHGVAAGYSVADFRARTGHRPAVWSHFVVWGGRYGYAIREAQDAGARVMLAVVTSKAQNEPGRISPGGIARGRGDRYLIGLSRALAGTGEPAYVRFLAEANNCHVAWSSHDCSGAPRNRDHSAARFKQAWKRATLIMRGGDVGRIDHRLRGLGMPPLQTDSEKLPQGQVAMLWTPMTGGSPMIAALRPRAFWPGRQWVDWVGTSFYSRFPNFRWLTPFYREFAQGERRPFAFGEWAMWGGDSASFVHQLFSWVHSHPRTRMMIYNQGNKPNGPFRLRQFPAATRALRAALHAKLFHAGF